jgi:hypothetical protein
MKRSCRILFCGLVAGLIVLLARSGHAEAPSARFALIIGVNRSGKRDLAPLRYADDDAARYHDLFRLLGASTHILARMDANTKRLHPQATAEAVPPRRAELERTVRRIAAEIQRAKRKGIRTTLYFVYAGHGDLEGEEAAILLEDQRLNAARLAALFERIGANSVHLLVDACHSGLLAQSRGPGGKRRPLRGFSQAGPLVKNPRIGMLLSTSSGRESHEWEAFQAGVFSHEVRSGLYGAADANHDGRVSYREIAAFVDRANAAIPNERFRPDVYARPPSGSDVLADVRLALRRRVEVPSQGHWILENDIGVRIADLNPSHGHAMQLARHNGVLFVRRLPESLAGEPLEYTVPTTVEVVSLAELEPTTPRVAIRGAAHVSFTRLFTLPFGPDTVRRYDMRSHVTEEALAHGGAARDAGPRSRRATAITVLGLGTAAAWIGGVLVVSAHRVQDSIPEDAAQQVVAERNERIVERNVAAGVAFGIAGAAAVAGVTLLLWPSGTPTEIGVSGSGIWLRTPLAP